MRPLSLLVPALVAAAALLHGVHAAIIPKGLSSLLTNAKVPAPETVHNGVGTSNAASNSYSFTDALKKLTKTSSNSKVVDTASGNVERKLSSLESYRETWNDFSNMYVNDHTTGIMLTSESVLSNALQKLGIKGSSINLPGMVQREQTEQLSSSLSFLPSNSKSVFLFSVGEGMEMNAESLSGSIPFNIKGSYNVEDYNLLIPIAYLQRLKLSPVLLEEFLVKSGESVLYCNQPLNFNTPLLISYVREALSSDNTNASKLSNLFFEIVSKNWFQSSASTIDFLQSSFCFVNEQDKSICLQIDNNAKNINFTPAFKEGKLNWNGMATKASQIKSDKRDNDSEITIQVGEAKLAYNKHAFANTTRCKTPEAYPNKPAIQKGLVFL